MQQPDTETNVFLRNGFLSNTRDTKNKSTATQDTSRRVISVVTNIVNCCFLCNEIVAIET
jgi:hypothetical protein